MIKIKTLLAETVNLEHLTLAGKASIVLTPVIGLLSPVKHLFLPLIFLMVLDVITGIYKNRVIKGQAISSKELFRKKPQQFLLWSAGLLTMLICDIFLKEINITGHWAALLYCVFYGLYEVISILENIAEMGLPGAEGILKLLKGKLPSNVKSALEETESDDKK